jgi:replicative DNA helicase
MANVLPKAQQLKLKNVMNDPVKWAQTFLISYDKNLKKDTPWTARWYQVQMLRDKSLKKVYRCGRRTGKSEVMVIEALYNATTNRNYRVLLITPYEAQVRLLFMRLNELKNSSPLLASLISSTTKNPYKMEFKNGSCIMGFTTGASSGSSGASIRGQAADLLILDECDYMADGDFDSIIMIAGERPDIRVIMSSTPTGRRGNFYNCCTNKATGYVEHYHPSTHNPQWCEKMEAEMRAMLSEQGYIHEVLAEFGDQDTGVFNKDRLDEALTFYDYSYRELDCYQKMRCEESGKWPEMLIYDETNPAPPNMFRTMGVDWDKYGASSSILILEYNMKLQKFMVLLRYEMPKAEYSYDEAVNTIIRLNRTYNPSFIYCDRGAGEYQIERLHIYGDEHPESGLKQKVVGWSFSNKLTVHDPVTGEEDSKPMKPFMVSQLQIAFERNNLALSPYDEVLFKQLIDYEVERMGANGIPTFTSKEEHFIDALGLAYLAMTLRFKQLTGVMQDLEVSSNFVTSNVNLARKDDTRAMGLGRTGKVAPEVQEFYENYQYDEHPDEQQKWVKTNFSSSYYNNNSFYNSSSRSTWGSRSGGLGNFRR